MIILFRGQTRRFGEKVRATDGFPLPSNFVYGGLFPANDGQDFAIIYQQYPDIKKFAVYADTVGQYINRDDIHGVKIFDGDILKVPDFRIYCYADSAAEQYAIGNEIDYTLLGAPVDTPSVTVTQPTAGTVEKTDNGDGTITLTATANKLAEFTNWVIDGDFEIVEGSLTSETITIRPKADGIKISTVFDLPTTGIYGDVNYDGKVNMLDVLLIRKYIAKQPIDLDENLADVTCDDKINMLDVLLIRKYIAKQPVTLGPKG